jgi:hypothetical protein
MDAADANTINKRPSKSKGGRPLKAVKRKITLTIKCTSQEAIYIKTQAKQGGITISEYLRTLGVSGKVVMQIKTIDPQVLKLTAAINHDGALLNQIAKKRNSKDELNAFEREELMMLTGRLKIIVSEIEKHLK